MFPKFVLIVLLVSASSCARQDPNQTQLVPTTPTTEERKAESTNESVDEPPLEVATEPEGEEMPSPSVSGPNDEDKESARPAKRTQSSRSAPVTGCSSETCINHCKPFGANKQVECATAFAAGCFEPTRDPLQCGGYGAVKEKSQSRDNIEEMPTPRL